MNPILDSLRDATRESHRHLESALQIESCIADREAYRRLLGGFLGLHEPFEQRLAECAGLNEAGYRIGDRTKVAALKRDLASLGVPEESIAALPRFAAAPFANVAAALGAAYVLEGSTLGGQSITRLIAAKSPGLPAEFFNVYGPQTRDRWVTFLECLATIPSSPANLADAAESGRATFDNFAQWLT